MGKYSRLLIPVGLVIFGLLIFFFIPKDSEEDKVLKERGLQIQEIDDPEGSVTEIVAVAPEAVPKTMEERRFAPSIALLPNRTGYPEMNGEAPLPPGEAQKAKETAEDFLRIWESYDPEDFNYKNRLKPFVTEEFLADVSSRKDSIDPPGICPEAGCKKGSRWFKTPSFEDSAFVIDWKEPYLYLVSYGAVVYTAEGQKDGYAQRSFGILMRKDGSKWLVERVAAESLN